MHSITAILATIAAASIALNICAIAWIIGALFHRSAPSAEALWQWYETAVLAAKVSADVRRIKGIEL